MDNTYAEKSLQAKLEEAVWAAKALFTRGKTSGTTANISFLHEEKIYISCSGSCFGTLTEADFVAVPLEAGADQVQGGAKRAEDAKMFDDAKRSEDFKQSEDAKSSRDAKPSGNAKMSEAAKQSEVVNSCGAVKRPSKELPLHRMLYLADGAVQAVLHAHCPYAALWSCLEHEHPRNVIPAYTPYLGMKLGRVAGVPYAKPGSPELFAAFKACLGGEHGYLLAKHGPIVGGKSMLNAFEALEELEQSAFIAWQLRLGKVDGVSEV